MTKKSAIILSIVLTAIITTAIIFSIQAIYNTLKPTLTLVFYKIEYTKKEITTNYTEEYACIYIRLNSKGNHTLEVNDFSIFTNKNVNNNNYKTATYIEYFDQEIRTNFYTYPNQPELKVYFNATQTEIGTVPHVKYKDTTMRIGEFATEK